MVFQQPVSVPPRRKRTSLLSSAQAFNTRQAQANTVRNRLIERVSTPNQPGSRIRVNCRGLEAGGNVMKKKLLAIATASLFTVGVAAAQTTTTSPTDNTSPADQSSPAALPNQGDTGTRGQSDSTSSSSTSTIDQSGTTDQSSQGKKKKKKKAHPAQDETNDSSTPNQSAPDSTTPGW
jgi:hypothetical protein